MHCNLDCDLCPGIHLLHANGLFTNNVHNTTSVTFSGQFMFTPSILICLITVYMKLFTNTIEIIWWVNMHITCKCLHIFELYLINMEEIFSWLLDTTMSHHFYVPVKESSLHGHTVLTKSDHLQRSHKMPLSLAFSTQIYRLSSRVDWVCFMKQCPRTSWTTFNVTVNWNWTYLGFLPCRKWHLAYRKVRNSIHMGAGSGNW